MFLKSNRKILFPFYKLQYSFGAAFFLAITLTDQKSLSSFWMKRRRNNAKSNYRFLLSTDTKKNDFLVRNFKKKSKKSPQKNYDKSIDK